MDLFLKKKRGLIVHFGIKGLLSVTPKMWQLVPDSIKEKKHYRISKTKLKSGEPESVHVDFAKIIKSI